MTGQFDPAAVIIISALALLLMMGLAVLLFILVHQRRMKHRSDMVELRLQHAEAVRQVEREVEGQTLTQVAMELHDNVGQLLTALRLDLDGWMNDQVPRPDVPRMKTTAERAIDELRRLSKSLNTDHLRVRPLMQLLEDECQRLHRPGQREVVLIASTSHTPVAADDQVVLYRIFQEALNNTLKHARATRITVTLVNNGSLRMAVEDNGSGFEPSTVRGGGSGLENIRRRAALINATCTVISSPGQGTTIIIAR